jgi:hypothetical protein
MIQHVANKINAVAGLEAIVDGETIYVEDTDGIGFTRSHDGNLGVAGFFREVLDEYKLAVEDEAAHLLDEYNEEAYGDPNPEEGTFGELAAEAFHEGDDEFPAPEEKALEIALEEERLANEAEEAQAPEHEAAELPQEKPMFDTVKQFLNNLWGLPPQEPAEAPASPVKAHVPDSEQLALAREVNSTIYPRSAKALAQALANDDQDRGGVPNPDDYLTLRLEEAAMAEVVHAEQVEFVVTGTGYVNGPFERSFSEVEKAKKFARQCVAAAKNENYAATITLTPWYRSA